MNRQTAYQVLCLALFVPAMFGVDLVVKWGIAQFDWLFIVPWVLGFLLIAWLMDRSEKKAAREAGPPAHWPDFHND